MKIKRFAMALGATLEAMLFRFMFRTGSILCDNDPTVPVAVTKSLEKISDQVREIGEKAMSEAKKHGDMTSETKATVDKLLLDFGGVTQQVKDIEQKLVAADNREKTAEKSLGEAITDSDEFKEFVKAGFKGRASIPVSRKAITSASASAGPGVAPDFRPTIISLGRRKFTVRDLMLPGRTSQAAVTYVRELGFTNNAAPVSETVKKPESTLTLEAIVQSVITIAHFAKASNQILADIPQLQSYIEGRLRYGLEYAEEVQLLKGSGVGLNLNGIYTQATAYANPGVTVDTETMIDRIRLAMLQAFLAEFPPTGTVLNPIDWCAIELTKDANKNYIVGNATGQVGPTLWGLPVVETQAMTANTGLVGAFRPLAQIFDREDVNVVIATENEDDFVKNLITVRCEERLASAVYRPEGFVKIADITP